MFEPLRLLVREDAVRGCWKFRVIDAGRNLVAVGYARTRDKAIEKGRKAASERRARKYAWEEVAL